MDPWREYLVYLCRVFLGDVIHGGTKALWISMGAWNPIGLMLFPTCWRALMMNVAHLMMSLARKTGLGRWTMHDATLLCLNVGLAHLDVTFREVDVSWKLAFGDFVGCYPTFCRLVWWCDPIEGDVIALGSKVIQRPPLKKNLGTKFPLFCHFCHYLAYVGKSQIILVKVNVKTWIWT